MEISTLITFILKQTILEIFTCFDYLYIETNQIDGSAQYCSNSSANALELLQSCANPSMISLLLWSHAILVHVKHAGW